MFHLNVIVKAVEAFSNFEVCDIDLEGGERQKLVVKGLFSKH